jgi:hypothetical protein
LLHFTKATKAYYVYAIIMSYCLKNLGFDFGDAFSTYGENRGSYGVLVGNLRERGHLEDLGVDGRIILRWIFS